MSAVSPAWRPTALFALLTLIAVPQVVDGDQGPPARVYRDVDGEPLPFQTDAAVEAFLRTATVTSQREIGVGVTRPRQLVLEKDRLTVHAAFNYVDINERGKRLADGTIEMYFLDSYRADLAAYELSRLLGLEMIPPSVKRRVDGEYGVVRLWIENLESYRDWLAAGNSGLPSSLLLQRQLMDQTTFDLLIRNTDRNQTNIHWERDGNLWLIDQTRSLAPDSKIPGKQLERFKGCSRELYESIKALDAGEVKQALSAHVGAFEIKALMKRRDRLIEHIDSLIARRGEEQVLFDYGDPPKGVVIRYAEDE